MHISPRCRVKENKPEQSGDKPFEKIFPGKNLSSMYSVSVEMEFKDTTDNDTYKTKN